MQISQLTPTCPVSSTSPSPAPAPAPVPAPASISPTSQPAKQGGKTSASSTVTGFPVQPTDGDAGPAGDEGGKGEQIQLSIEGKKGMI